MTELTQLNIYFKISEPYNSKIIEVSQNIKKEYDTFWTLDNKLFIPHFSLYLFALPKNNLPKVLEQADRLAASFQPINIEFDKLFISGRDRLMLGFKENETIYNYHLQVLEAFNQLREGKQRKKYANPDYFAKLPEPDRSCLEAYGYRFIKDKFKPHITLSVFNNETDCTNAFNQYRNTFSDLKAHLDYFQIMEDNYETSNATKIIYSKQL